MTTLPCRGRITRFAEDSGSITSEHGTEIRFGRTSCSGFEPAIGLEVWVMATRTIPALGERATLVNLTGTAEPADPAERARLRHEAAERAIAERHAAQASSKRSFLARACDLPPGWHPGLATLADELALPPALALLTRLDERAGEVNDVRAARQRALAAELGVSAVFEHGAASVLRIGPCAPWPIQDASLVPFAQLDGEEPDLFALVYHPEVYRARSLLPVIYWRHDDSSGFVCEDAVAFVAALAHGRVRVGAHHLPARPELLTGLADPGLLAETVIGSWIGGLPTLPAELAALAAQPADVARAADELTALSLGSDHAAIAAASEALEQRYRALGWRYHERHAQFQRLRYFAE